MIGTRSPLLERISRHLTLLPPQLLNIPPTMGFTTGLVSSSRCRAYYNPTDKRSHQLGGTTLTLSTLYLTLHLHRQNRAHQSLLLRQQASLLDAVVDPPAPGPPPVERPVRAGMLEAAKDRWNAELEENVRRLNTTDWGLVREQAEDVLRAGWRSLTRLGQQAKEQAK